MGAPAITSTPTFDLARLVIRPLTSDDSHAYRILRQRILESGDGKYFSTSYVRENGFTTEQHWRDWCMEQHDHCTIGIFVDGELVGIMGIVQFGHADDRMVEWEATWLDPNYRGLGIARLSYEKVHQWTKEHGYQQAVVFIREGNLRSRQIREAQGAVHLHTLRNEAWADGSLADVDFFIIDLFPTKTHQDSPYERALRHLNEIHESLVENTEEPMRLVQKIG